MIYYVGDHIRIINEIRNYCDILFIQIESDKDVKFEKGEERPIICEDERAFIVDNIKGVDFVIIATETDTTTNIKKLLNSGEYNTSDKAILMRDGYIIDLLRPNIVFTSTEEPAPEIIKHFCKQMKIKIKTLPVGNGIHTTDIINKCRNL